MKIKKTIQFFRQALFRPDPRMIYAQGWHGHDNLGDEAVYGAMRKLFKGINFVDFTKSVESKSAAKKYLKSTGLFWAAVQLSVTSFLM